MRGRDNSCLKTPRKMEKRVDSFRICYRVNIFTNKYRFYCLHFPFLQLEKHHLRSNW